MKEWELRLGLPDAEGLIGQWEEGGLSRDNTNEGTEAEGASQHCCWGNLVIKASFFFFQGTFSLWNYSLIWGCHFDTFFKAAPRGLQDLSSLIRGGTQALGSKSAEL